MKSKLIYWLTYAGMWLLALLPFRALYILSDGLYLLMLPCGALPSWGGS